MTARRMEPIAVDFWVLFAPKIPVSGTAGLFSSGVGVGFGVGVGVGVGVGSEDFLSL